jgi:excisionase family DNA binding protein
MEALKTTAPDDSEVAAAGALLRLLEGLDAALLVEGGEGAERVQLPDTALRLLIQVLAHIANGDGVAVVPVRAELTTQQAAELLQVSRPHVVKLLDEQAIPCRKVGTHRRVMLTDVLAYRDAADAKRRTTLAELTREADDLGLYD